MYCQTDLYGWGGSEYNTVKAEISCAVPKTVRNFPATIIGGCLFNRRKQFIMPELPPYIQNLSDRPEGEINMVMINALTNAEIDYISELYERGNISGSGIAILITSCFMAGFFIGWCI